MTFQEGQEDETKSKVDLIWDDDLELMDPEDIAPPVTLLMNFAHDRPPEQAANFDEV